MKTNNTFECEICFFRSNAEDFIPITASADFTALECPKCLNNDAESFAEIDNEIRQAA